MADAIAKRHPRLTTGNFYIAERSRNRWRIVVRRRGGETIQFFETRADANRYRQRLTDAGLVGFFVGGVA